MLSTVDRTSPGLLPFLSSLFWDEPIIPTKLFLYLLQSVGRFIPLGNHHSQARIFEANMRRTAILMVPMRQKGLDCEGT